MSGKCKNCFYAYKSNYWTYKCRKHDDKRVLANNRATCFAPKTAHKLGTTPKEAYKGMTNGEVIMALFPKASITEIGGGATIVVANNYKFNATWWNAPYEREAKNE